MENKTLNFWLGFENHQCTITEGTYQVRVTVDPTIRTVPSLLDCALKAVFRDFSVDASFLDYPMTDALLDYLIKNHFTSFSNITFDGSDLTAVTKDKMKEFFDALAESNSCDELIIHNVCYDIYKNSDNDSLNNDDMNVPVVSIEDLIENHPINDSSLDALVKSTSLYSISFDLFGGVTGTLLRQIADRPSGFPRLFSIKLRGIPGTGVKNELFPDYGYFIEKWKKCQNSSAGSLTVTTEVRNYLYLHCEPDRIEYDPDLVDLEDDENRAYYEGNVFNVYMEDITCSYFYKRPYGHPFYLQELEITFVDD
uniref:Uncharacterized protein n=1 Tax=Plectus sambesii TaxID=2011161 RepID=A0A914X2Q6_9BILA